MCTSQLSRMFRPSWSENLTSEGKTPRVGRRLSLNLRTSSGKKRSRSWQERSLLRASKMTRSNWSKNTRHLSSRHSTPSNEIDPRATLAKNTIISKRIETLSTKIPRRSQTSSKCNVTCNWKTWRPNMVAKTSTRLRPTIQCTRHKKRWMPATLQKCSNKSWASNMHQNIDQLLKLSWRLKH